jgi:hypothetical protein
VLLCSPPRYADSGRTDTAWDEPVAAVLVSNPFSLTPPVTIRDQIGHPIAQFPHSHADFSFLPYMTIMEYRRNQTTMGAYSRGNPSPVVARFAWGRDQIRYHFLERIVSRVVIG